MSFLPKVPETINLLFFWESLALFLIFYRMSDFPGQKWEFSERRIFRKKRTGFMSYLRYLVSQELRNMVNCRHQSCFEESIPLFQSNESAMDNHNQARNPHDD